MWFYNPFDGIGTIRTAVRRRIAATGSRDPHWTAYRGNGSHPDRLQKSGYDRFAILQQGNRQIENIAGSVQSLHIVPRVIPEQIAEGLNCSLQNIRIILFKGSGEIILNRLMLKEFLAFSCE